MPHSLRVKIKGLRYKGIITDKDCDRLCKALDNEDVLDKIRTEIELKEKTLTDKYGQQKYGVWTDDVLQIINKYKGGMSMELMWVCWFIFGLVSGVIASVFSVCKGTHDGHCNSVPDTDEFDRERDGMDRRIPTPEEITMILTYFKVGASHRETEVLDYLIDKEGEDDEAY